jgi:hypothetical protein
MNFYLLLFGLAYLVPALVAPKNKWTPLILGLGTVIAVIHLFMGEPVWVYAIVADWTAWLFRLRAFGVTSFRGRS